MNTVSAFRAARRLGLPLVLVAATTLAQAQTLRRVAPAAQPASPSMATRAAGALPSPSGLAPNSGNPAGLNSQFPAGLTAATAAATATTDTAAEPATNTMGAAGSYAAPAGRASVGTGGAGYTPLQIAQSFLGADANRDGELTRAEAQRLTIAPYSFEEMDRNHDGILSRFEYEDGVR
ncbi:MAG: hypothetical protein ACAH21_11400 [Ramlibacter sp.]|nr:hypothetical protein [Ramlibacter sp.]